MSKCSHNRPSWGARTLWRAQRGWGRLCLGLGYGMSGSRVWPGSPCPRAALWASCSGCRVVLDTGAAVYELSWFPGCGGGASPHAVGKGCKFPQAFEPTPPPQLVLKLAPLSAGS